MWLIKYQDGANVTWTREWLLIPVLTWLNVWWLHWSLPLRQTSTLLEGGCCLCCVQEWKKEGLRLSTTSNEAAKLYDIATSQVSSVNKLATS